MGPICPLEGLAQGQSRQTTCKEKHTAISTNRVVVLWCCGRWGSRRPFRPFNGANRGLLTHAKRCLKQSFCARQKSFFPVLCVIAMCTAAMFEQSAIVQEALTTESSTSPVGTQLQESGPQQVVQHCPAFLSNTWACSLPPPASWSLSHLAGKCCNIRTLES